MTPAFVIEEVSIRYDGNLALADVTLDIPGQGVTALVGPSGCGKSSLLRSLNRLNDLAAGASLEGRILFDGNDIHADDVDLVALRRRVGMVFQRPSAFPMSIADNVAYGLRLMGRREDEAATIEESLRRAGLWDEVRADLAQPATGLSVGQQQRLSIARCLAVRPEVLLMDEPTASLDPVSTTAIERLVKELADEMTVVLVTHDLRQAERIAERVAFFTTVEDEGRRHGVLVEHGPTRPMFDSPGDARTAEYLGRRDS